MKSIIQKIIGIIEIHSSFEVKNSRSCTNQSLIIVNVLPVNQLKKGIKFVLSICLWLLAKKL